MDDGVGRDRPDVGELSLLLLLADVIRDCPACLRIEPNAVEDVRLILLAGRGGDLLRLNELQAGPAGLALGQEEKRFAIVEPATGSQ